ncbi:MAG: mechanosensitive ion channel [Bacteroidetes bacterium]|nr:mechanosensitive ion channel [Bacteroidota bacterium]
MFDFFSDRFIDWLIQLGLSNDLAIDITNYSGFVLLVILSGLIYFILKSIGVKTVHSLAKKSKTHWDDIIMNKKVFIRLAYLIPVLILNFFTKYILYQYTISVNILNTLFQILIIIIAVSVVTAVLNSFNEIYQSYKIARSRPVKGYLQVAKIILYTLAAVAIISVFYGKDGYKLLAGFGAFSAVLMLVFKDPILGFVGGIQLASNNMVRIDDWISMPKFGADGSVIDITLTTVKIQNWDKTIVTIPTYNLVTDSFQNWRGMEESGGRRIKRSLNIDMNSVKFCDEIMLNKFRSFLFIKEYLSAKETELTSYNKKYNIDNSVLVNGRRQTNLGVFRAYLKSYLKHKPEINNEMTFLIRQLQPTENGIPMEVYVFSKIQDWGLYEDIQADIFDHILAVISQFELKVFQQPSGSDFQKLNKL